MIQFAAEPAVTRLKPFTMQVCVPEDWTEEQIVEFANCKVLSGTSNGWMIMDEDDRALDGDPLRVPCEKHKGFIHTVLTI